jgi:regulator of protease activity HflC (stomatin/prohibitin superfamily)
MVWVISAIFLIIVFSLNKGIHIIYEGNIGCYWRGGKLMDGFTEPGYHYMIPFITSVENIQINIQTDRVENIPCGTSGGVMIYFDNIEVVNRLKKELAWETIKNYTVHYDKTWIFDKIQ